MTPQPQAPDGPLREFTLPQSQPSERLDKVLARLVPEHSRSRLQAWISEGFVKVNGAPARVRQMVQAGDHLEVNERPDPESQAFQPEDLPLDILGESPDWLVVNKPAGLVTHPGAGNWQGTLLNALLFHYPELQQVARAGIVHRLDKDTSGVLVVARTVQAQTDLVRQLQARTVDREYGAWVHGHLAGNGRIDAPIGRDRHVPVRMAAANAIAPKTALTHYQVVDLGRSPAGDTVSCVRCELHTGRTHQIRVHLASIGHPLVGDTLYGGRILPHAQRQMLHARRLRFSDRQSGASREFTAPWPADFQAFRAGVHDPDSQPQEDGP